MHPLRPIAPSGANRKARTTARIAWRQWDDQTVIYHVGSGDTHLLSPIAAETLRLIEGGVGDAAELTAAVAASMRVESNAPLQAAVESALQEFEKLGVIERT